jgi:hypothetical protein
MCIKDGAAGSAPFHVENRQAQSIRPMETGPSDLGSTGPGPIVSLPCSLPQSSETCLVEDFFVFRRLLLDNPLLRLLMLLITLSLYQSLIR